jgi:hypothetical protein
MFHQYIQKHGFILDLVIDEAELLFHSNPSKGDKDYVLRIASKMEDINNRGRKHKYGVILVTHLPSEVSQKVGELANTKIAFGCSGAPLESQAFIVLASHFCYLS